MATKSQIRAYAQKHNITNAEAKQHFLNESTKKAQLNIGQMEKHFDVPHNFDQFGHLQFDRQSEIGKLLRLVTNDPPAYDIKSNRADFDQLWTNTEAGFLIAVVPRQGHKWLSKTTDAKTVKQVLDGFNIQQINNDWTVLCAYCSSDLAFDKYVKLFDTLHCAVIGYTTPANLSTLSEDVDLITQLRLGKKAKQFA